MPVLGLSTESSFETVNGRGRAVPVVCMSQPAGSLPARLLSLLPSLSLPGVPGAGLPFQAALSSAPSLGSQRRCCSCRNRPGARHWAPSVQGWKCHLGSGQAKPVQGPAVQPPPGTPFPRWPRAPQAHGHSSAGSWLPGRTVKSSRSA